MFADLKSHEKLLYIHVESILSIWSYIVSIVCGVLYLLYMYVDVKKAIL